MKVYTLLACLFMIGCVSSEYDIEYDIRKMSPVEIDVMYYRKGLGNRYRSEVGYMIRNGYRPMHSKYCREPRHWIWVHRGYEDREQILNGINYFECHTNSPAYRGYFTEECTSCITNVPKYYWEGDRVYVMEGSNKVYKIKPKFIWW